jgi:hypothetical protein
VSALVSEADSGEGGDKNGGGGSGFHHICEGRCEATGKPRVASPQGERKCRKRQKHSGRRRARRLPLFHTAMLNTSKEILSKLEHRRIGDTMELMKFFDVGVTYHLDVEDAALERELRNMKQEKCFDGVHRSEPNTVQSHYVSSNITPQIIS